MKKGQFWILLFLGIVWLGGSAFGLAQLNAYSNIPGEAAEYPQSWPRESSIRRQQPFTLLLFLHPECGCSNATLGELDSLLAKAKGQLETYVIFIPPEGWTTNEVQSDLWRKARKISGVKTLIDVGSKEANLFGAKTSGQTYLFDRHGELKFSGGITAARGHSGDNQGKTNVIDILQNNREQIATASVFGCELFDRFFKGIL